MTHKGLITLFLDRKKFIAQEKVPKSSYRHEKDLRLFS